MEEVQQPSINYLPDEILLIIFSYLSTEDIIAFIRRTCVRWCILSFNNQLWKERVFSPDSHLTDLDVIALIASNPQIKNFVFERRRDYDTIIPAIKNSCEDVRKIVIRNKHGPSLLIVLEAVQAFPNMETFETILGIQRMCFDMSKLFGKLHIAKRFAVINRPASSPLIKYVVFLRKEILVTLALTCKLTSKYFWLICNCTQLRYLNLYNVGTPNSHIDISPLSQLKHLETLQLVRFPDTYETPLPNFEGIEFSKLTRLEIYEGGKMLEAMVNTFLVRSPRIKHLNLNANQLEDSQIEKINCCAHLEYLDVSYNFFLGDNFLSALSCCSKLKFLDITCCTGISEAFIIILCNCKDLEAMTLEGYHFLGYYFSFIPWLFPNLKEFHVKHFSDLNVICELKYDMPMLDITRCSCTNECND